MVSPVVLVLLAITGFPLAYNLWNSFRNYNLYYPVAGNPFVGLTNYRNAFTQPGLVGAIKNTLGYTVVSVTVEIALGPGGGAAPQSSGPRPRPGANTHLAPVGCPHGGRSHRLENVA